jgi:hypothetical protein
MRPRFGELWPWRRRTDESLAGVEDLLTRYAQHGFNLSPAQQQRLRATTLEAFGAKTGADRGSHGSRWASGRLAFAFALVALLTLGGTVAAAESGPGQPFYHVRLTIESLTVPANGTARTNALFAQLDRRLDEASAESDQGNGPGVADAVRAYQATFNEMNVGIGAGVSQTAIEAGLERHVNVLQRILGSAPANAHGGVQTALHQAEQAQQALHSRSGGPSRPSHPAPPQSPAGRP